MTGILNAGKRSRMVAAGVLTVGLLGAVGFTQAANGDAGGQNGVQAADQHRTLQAGSTATCQKYWIVVNSDGTPARGSCGAVDSTRLSAGTYQVDWKRKERLCGRFATIGLPGASGASSPGFITTVGRAGRPKSTFVQTFDTTGSTSDRAFAVHLAC